MFVNSISPNNKYGTRYINPTKSNDGTHQINYAPTLGTATVKNDQVGKPMTEREPGPIQSPALGFLHELGHFLGYVSDDGVTSGKLHEETDDLFDDAEEKRVSEGAEAIAAKHLHEPLSTNHSGVPVIVKDPTSRIKVDDVNVIKQDRMIRQAQKNSSEKDSIKHEQ